MLMHHRIECVVLSALDVLLTPRLQSIQYYSILLDTGVKRLLAEMKPLMNLQQISRISEGLCA
jgi:hypothetical protein